MGAGTDVQCKPKMTAAQTFRQFPLCTAAGELAMIKFAPTNLPALVPVFSDVRYRA